MLAGGQGTRLGFVFGSVVTASMAVSCSSTSFCLAFDIKSTHISAMLVTSRLVNHSFSLSIFTFQLDIAFPIPGLKEFLVGTAQRFFSFHFFEYQVVAMSTETLKISDGTSMEITRVPDIDDETWGEVKKYVESNPETAKALQSFAKNPEAMRGWLQTQAIAEHYNTKMSAGDAPVQDRMKSLESDPELGPIFEDIKKNGLEAALKYYQDRSPETNDLMS